MTSVWDCMGSFYGDFTVSFSSCGLLRRLCPSIDSGDRLRMNRKFILSTQSGNATSFCRRIVTYRATMYYIAMRNNDVGSAPYDLSLDWESEDFIDTDKQPIVEDDPWSDSPIACELEDIDDDSVINETASSDIDDYPFEEDEGFYSDEDGENLYSPFDDLSGTEWDEPEPLAEYDSDLSGTLHISEDVSGIYRNIKIDEFVASISPITDAQRVQISQLLGGMSAGRLRSWLPWLWDQDWTGHSLLLFLEFRINYWEETPEWWEYTFWHSSQGHWWTYPSSSYNMLSRDATYDLVHARLAYSSDEIIDEAWLKDWEDFALWKHGFPSFAGFAVFRAEPKNGEDWRSMIVWNTDLSKFTEETPCKSGLYNVSHRVDPLMASLDGGRYSVWEDSLSYRKPQGLPLWFAMQDWYDPSEWHDNLGWPYDCVEATHPYLLGNSSNDMSGPYTNPPYK